MQFNSLVPELYISDFEESLHFYISIIGFKSEYQREAPRFAFLSYQGSQLMIQELVAGERVEQRLEHPFGRGINFQIDTENVQDVVESLKAHHYPLQRGPKDSSYRAGDMLHGCREILVTDPDGYLLRFSQQIGDRGHTTMV